ncbi:MAG TPA: GAF domain-containing protein, partial [Ktedonobacteraceae bacterium]|nr:GAF domain-containing protein [Ktedonobacteraceae bacterium]
MFHPQEITRIGQEINSEQTLHSIIDKTRNAAKADIIVLYPYETALRRFIFPPLIAGELLDSPVQPLSLGLLDDSAERVALIKDSHFAKDCATFYKTLQGSAHSLVGSFSQREKVRSIAAVPLQVGDELVGVLFINFRQPQRFDAAQKLFIDGLAQYAAIAIKNMRTL